MSATHPLHRQAGDRDASATFTLNSYSSLWPTAEGRTRSVGADLMSQCGLDADSPYSTTR
jgi:hypothetical protein